MEPEIAPEWQLISWLQTTLPVEEMAASERELYDITSLKNIPHLFKLCPPKALPPNLQEFLEPELATLAMAGCQVNGSSTRSVTLRNPLRRESTLSLPIHGVMAANTLDRVWRRDATLRQSPPGGKCIHTPAAWMSPSASFPSCYFCLGGLYGWESTGGTFLPHWYSLCIGRMIFMQKH